MAEVEIKVLPDIPGTVVCQGGIYQPCCSCGWTGGWYVEWRPARTSLSFHLCMSHPQGGVHVVPPRPRIFLQMGSG